MPSGVSREPAPSLFLDASLWVGCVLWIVVVLVAPFLWNLYWARFPGPAPRTPSVLVDNPAMAQAMLPLDGGVMGLRCTPHGKNPAYGWTCAVQQADVGRPVTVEVNQFPEPVDETLYHAGLSFAITRDMTEADSDNPVNWGGRLHVALSVDPTVATFEDTAGAIVTVTRLAEATLSAQQNQAMVDRIEADKARAAAAQASKSPIGRAHENLATWKRAATDVVPASGG